MQYFQKCVFVDWDPFILYSFSSGTEVEQATGCMLHESPATWNYDWYKFKY